MELIPAIGMAISGLSYMFPTGYMNTAICWNSNYYPASLQAQYVVSL